ncbi:uncharacterized protein LOC114311137 [Camellia sinensis]|uniref:uncharacterized protein LOC114311137 n=1 Tax=Camellia sinensis TaxID=4442 RepID=UPI00103613EB|nr:uncharacterized protein LOC114311137 [Camellia sinensis]
MSEVLCLKRILRCFEIALGLKINYHKSVFCGIGLSDLDLHEFALLLNCKAQRLPLNYLGLPLGASPRRKKTWKPIIDKFKMRLAGWKKRFLSFTGRLTLVKAVLSSLPVYFMSLFKLPEVGNGCRIKFWHDKWGRDISFKDEFPRLFQLSNDKEGSIRDLVEIRGSSYNWPLTFKRHLFEWEKEELLRINGVLRGAPAFNLQVNDLALWSAAKPGQTLVSIFYNHTNLALGPNAIFSRWVWINYLSPKVQFFGWLAWRNKVKTLVFLQQLGNLDRDSSTLCTFGKSQQESIEHVLIFCPMRNECLFQGSQLQLQDLHELIITRLAFWYKAASKRCPFSINDFLSSFPQIRYCLGASS